MSDERVKRIASDGYLLSGDDLVGEYDRIELSNTDGMTFDWEIVANGDTLVIQERDADE